LYILVYWLRLLGILIPAAILFFFVLRFVLPSTPNIDELTRSSEVQVIFDNGKVPPGSQGGNEKQHVASNLFSQDPGAYWELPAVYPMTLTVNFTKSPLTIVAYSLSVGPNGPESSRRMPRSWQFEGYDGNWVVLDQRQNVEPWHEAEVRRFPLQKVGNFLRYRFIFGAGGNSRLMRIAKIGFEIAN
jgi:hypothetical protein